jgi:hypothetical protein
MVLNAQLKSVYQEELDDAELLNLLSLISRIATLL